MFIFKILQNGGIQVTNLHKVYDENIKAVNGLSLNVAQGQILALLGHNGIKINKI